MLEEGGGGAAHRHVILSIALLHPPLSPGSYRLLAAGSPVVRSARAETRGGHHPRPSQHENGQNTRQPMGKHRSVLRSVGVAMGERSSAEPAWFGAKICPMGQSRLPQTSSIFTLIRLRISSVSPSVAAKAAISLTALMGI